jgi:hypothetical protein
MESALDFFRRGESILRIELQDNEITLGEYAVKHSMLYQKAKEMDKEQREKIFKQAQECSVKADGVYFKYEFFEQLDETFKSE